MIRINLLPGPRAKAVQKQQHLRTEVAIGIAALVLTLGMCAYFSWSLDREIENRQQEKQEKEKQLAVLKEKVKQVQDFEEKKKLLESKNRVIEQLQLSRAGPVRVLDFVSQSLDPLRIWLIRLQLKGQEVEIEGRSRVRGVISNAAEDAVTVETADAKSLRIPYDVIVRGNLIDEGLTT